MASTDGEHLVIFDPDAALVDLRAIRSTAEQTGISRVVGKLAQLGARLGPPHVKRLAGEPGLVELRPRAGDSSSRPIAMRCGDQFVVLAIARDHRELSQAIARAKTRRRRHVAAS